MLVKSQTVMPNKSANGIVPVHHENNLPSEIVSKTEETTMDSDDVSYICCLILFILSESL